MLDAGADDYIIKTGRIQPLINGLERAASRLNRRTYHSTQ
jgi:DNA-binding response OmpR family regulator